MSSRRTLVLVAAVLVGVVAALSLYSYVAGIEDRAYQRAERVEVFVATADIPRGTFGDAAVEQGLIARSQIPREFRPANAITSADQVAGLVAVSDLPANQIVVAGQFVSQAEAPSSFSSLLRNNEVAITVSVDQVRGVAGLLVPGDFVNVLVTAEAPEAGVFAQPARVLYQKVQVLAVGQQRALQPGETAEPPAEGAAPPADSGLITFAVPAAAAQRIASAGSVYLTLVPRDYVPEPLGPLDLNQPLPGEVPDQLTPYGPGGRAET